MCLKVETRTKIKGMHFLATPKSSLLSCIFILFFLCFCFFNFTVLETPCSSFLTFFFFGGMGIKNGIYFRYWDIVWDDNAIDK